MMRTDRARMLHVRGEGTPGEFGRLHGSLAREAIHANIQLYFHRFREEWRLQRGEVERRVKRYLEVIEEVDGAYLEAMEGVAEGAEAPFLEVAAINVRYELVYSEYSRLGREQALPSGCTAVSLLPSVSREGHLIMAQNWDWIPGIKGVVQEYSLEGGPRFISFTEAGIVGGKIGLNEEGLGMMINGLVSDQDNWERLGVPFHVRCWRTLQSRTLQEAASRLKEMPSSCSANFVLGQPGEDGGQVVDLEVSPVGVAELRPKDGFLVHANHFHRGEELGIWQPLMAERTSTFERQARMEWLVGKGRKGMGVEELRQFLSDHRGRPMSICRHPEPYLPENQRYETVVSVLMDLDQRRMLVAGGNPCDTSYEEFSLTT